MNIYKRKATDDEEKYDVDSQEGQQILENSVEHGFGIFENPTDGTVWYQEYDDDGNAYLYKSVDETEEKAMVENYLSEIIKEKLQ